MCRMGRMRRRAVQWIGDRRRENRLRKGGRMRGITVQRIVERRGENRSKDGENEGKREEGGEQCGGCTVFPVRNSITKDAQFRC